VKLDGTATVLIDFMPACKLHTDRPFPGYHCCLPPRIVSHCRNAFLKHIDVNVVFVTVVFYGTKPERPLNVRMRHT
jgi:hypothetical protein